MRKLTLTPPVEKRPVPDYFSIYARMYSAELDKYFDVEAPADRTDILTRLVYSGVRMMNSFKLNREHAEIIASSLFNLYQSVMASIGKLTPSQLMQIFPVEKDYDGERYGTKDYFSTMEAMRAHGLNRPIGQKVMDVLWDYMNPTLHVFLSGMMCAMDDIRRANGEKGMIEEFFGLTPHHLHTDSTTGKQYLQNADTGEVLPVEKKRPSHLKLVQ